LLDGCDAVVVDDVVGLEDESSELEITATRTIVTTASASRAKTRAITRDPRLLSYWLEAIASIAVPERRPLVRRR
jgi:hypothetical protein